MLLFRVVGRRTLDVLLPSTGHTVRLRPGEDVYDPYLVFQARRRGVWLKPID